MNDAFISYAHIDDQSLNEESRGWISQLHRALEVRIGQLLGEDLKIWRDPQLQRSDVFDATLVREFLDSKVMVSVFSPRYAKSEWCRREFEEFCKNAESQGGLRLGDKSRVFKVVKTPVDPSELPPVMRGLYETILGFEFYGLDPETGAVQEYDDVYGLESKKRFFSRVNDLAFELAQLLKSFDARTGLHAIADTADPEQASQSGKTVYLAPTTSDVREERDRIRRELLHRGHTVLPDTMLPMTAAEFEEAVRGCLQQADLSIHLIGSSYGMVPEDATESMVELQNRLAIEQSVSRGLPRLIWTARDVEARDARQADFLSRVRSDAATQRGAELIEGNVNLLKTLALEVLEPAPEPAKPATRQPAAAAGDSKAGAAAGLVYLIYDQSDEEAAAELEDFLFDSGLEVVTPAFDEDEAVATRAHIANLSDCSAAILYYGQARKSWVDLTLRDLLKAGGYGRSEPIPHQAVFVGPPEDRRKERFRSHHAQVMHQKGDTFAAPAELEAFVAAIKA